MKINNLIETPSQEMNVLIDWLTISIPIDLYPLGENNKLIKCDMQFIINDLRSLLQVSEDEVYYEDFGVNGYRNQIVISETIKILYNSRETSRDKTGRDSVSLLLSGQGCRRFEKLSHLSLYDLIRYLKYKYNAKCTRLDFSCDVLNCSYFSLKTLFTKIANFNYTSPCKSHFFNDKDGRTSTSRTGESCYVGSSGSDRYLLIYDKYEERRAKGLEILPSVNSWYRFELVFSHGMAQSVFNKISDTQEDKIPSLYLGVLNDFICIRTECTLNNPHANRLDVWNPWLKFIGSVEKIKIKNQSNLESNILSKIRWQEHSVSRSDFLLLLNFGDTEFHFQKMRNIAQYSKKAGKKELAEINTYRRDNNIPLMTEKEFDRKRIYLLERFGDDDNEYID